MNSTSEFEVYGAEEHPALSTYFRLPTPVLRDVIKQAFFEIGMKQTGVIFYGPPRVGKTRCYKALRVEIPKRFPNAYVISMIAVARENARHISTIVNQLIIQEGIEISRYASSNKIFNILIDKIAVRMRREQKNHLIFIFDELQRFAAADFFQLADIVNVLDDKGVKVTVISFGMPELQKIVGNFKTIKQLQIIARFMSDLRPFSGITSRDMLKLILGFYDTDMLYPEGSAISYTQYFFPKSFSLGWKLSMVADSLWEEMHKVATGDYVNNLPMEHVAAVVRYFYQISQVIDGTDKPISLGDIRDAIKLSKFREFCITVEEGGAL